jgi:hypothetical protein
MRFPFSSLPVGKVPGSRPCDCAKCALRRARWEVRWIDYKTGLQSQSWSKRTPRDIDSGDNRLIQKARHKRAHRSKADSTGRRRQQSQAHPACNDRGEGSDNQVNGPGSGNGDPKRKKAGYPRKRAAHHLAISLLRCQP